MTDSSDTDDSGYDKFKEAAIEIKDLMTTNPSGNTRHDSNTSEKITKKSLRIEKNTLEKHELQTTPEFRSHVAKKLSQLIDSSVELGCQWEEPQSHSPVDDESHIKLFSTSLENINTSTKKVPQQQRRRHKSITSSSCSSEDERISQAAVSSEFVLSSSGLPQNQQQGMQKEEQPNTDISHCNDKTMHTEKTATPSKVCNTGEIVVENTNKLQCKHDIVSKKCKKKKKKRKIDTLDKH